MNDDLIPPRLRDDCFAMPQGVEWVPVSDALARLRSALGPIEDTQTLHPTSALGAVLARDAVAQRSNPPRPNSAVDGYGFAHASTGDGVQKLPLVQGVAAAGRPFDGTVPAGNAVRILTGAILPKGVDTVVLEEDCAANATHVAFDGPAKFSANARAAGEDMKAGEIAVRAGQRLRAPDLALLSALNIAEVTVFRPLRVGVLSTGDEIIAAAGQPAEPHQIYDANRPMLLGLVQGWGYTPVDLGHVRDDPDEIAARLDSAAVDVILTTGGASAGDEDHVSRLLRDRGTLSSWRIALKPGRPLALALWDGVLVIGMPGNPVAALVCAAIFARPSLSLMAGAGWCEPLAMHVPAAFSKQKKPGRREFLRARLVDGAVEVFASEGSGRISSISWADGLVELPDEACDISPGMLVRYLPYAALGIF
jgi:molybdopterin molybdotransferase